MLVISSHTPHAKVTTTNNNISNGNSNINDNSNSSSKQQIIDVFGCDGKIIDSTVGIQYYTSSISTLCCESLN